VRAFSSSVQNSRINKHVMTFSTPFFFFITFSTPFFFFRSEEEMLQLRKSVLYGIEDARDNEVVINHFCALAAAATAAGCRSLPEWVDLRGGEAFLRSEIEKDMADAGVWVYIYVCVCV